MNLRNINTKKYYDSDEDDLLRDFYIPALSNSLSYKRIAGYFSSSSFMVAAKGLTNLIRNNGYMKLIINVGLSKSDYDAIIDGLINPEKIINSLLLEDLTNLENEIIKNHLRVLSWMIAKKMVEIKVAITKKEEISGIFHQKIGLLEDGLGNCISFSGSDNESANGWVYNIEEFKVFRSWVDEEKEFVEADKKKFDKFWNDQGMRTKVYDFPEAIKEKILEILPNNPQEYETVCKFIEDNSKKAKNMRKPRDYQLEAINSWFDNGNKGIFEMATGTGKTFTAITALKRVISSEKGLFCVVVCPYQHLVTQWSEDLDTEELKNICAFGSKNNWQNQLMNEILKLNMGYKDYLISVTTYDTFSSELFKNLVKTCKGEIMLIGDEIHAVGSEKRQDGLLEEYQFRLGLSATPSRWLDDKGTELIMNYFGGTVFSFDLKRAIESGFLTRYSYFPHFIELTPEEMDEYKSYAKKIAIAMSKNQSEKNESLNLLLIKRKKIITNAKNKLLEMKLILNSINRIKNCLIYCSPKQIKDVKEELARRGIIFHRFTSKENVNDRKIIKRKFAIGEYSVLVAMRCLDEGVDIPSTELGIIMASSGNPKEYIQRRGRLLRNFPGKTKAIIHDIIVVPSFNIKLPLELLENERKILKGELSRYQEFAESSLNPLYASKMIIKIQDMYGLRC